MFGTSRCSHTLRRWCAAAALAALLIPAGAITANAAEIIPSIGITKPVNDGDAEAKIYGGLAFRGDIIPILKGEIGVAYRQEERLAGNLDVRMWPVTASLWLAPTPAIYAGGGVGWYHTTLDFDESLLIDDETQQKFGVHLGGGLGVPLGPSLGIDLNGRYVFLEKEESALPPAEFDPDFWSTTLGLAFRF